MARNHFRGCFFVITTLFMDIIFLIKNIGYDSYYLRRSYDITAVGTNSIYVVAMMYYGPSIEPITFPFTSECQTMVSYKLTN